MKNKQTLLVFLLTLFLGNVSAHNIWIETNTLGKKGKEHIARIYLGGYGENERDSIGKWFSNTKEVTIWLTEPGGVKKKLSTKPTVNCLESVFTPEKDGLYTLSIAHELVDVYGTSKIQYYAVSQVQVGASGNGSNNLAAATDLSIQTIGVDPVVKKPVAVKVMYKGKNLDQTAVSVASPVGWVKGFETQDGIVTFDSLWPGRYVVEAYYNEKADGNYNGKDYKLVKHITTYSIEIK